MKAPLLTVVGAGLAGTELSLQLARLGHRVRLIEQKPLGRSPAHVTDRAAELVCSNSFRSRALKNAVGLLKEEMRRSGSFIMAAAAESEVPAGDALAVDRRRFSEVLESWLSNEPAIERVAERLEGVPENRPLVLATGPLTEAGLARDLEARLGEGSLAYYDAIAPVVIAESIDQQKIFFGSRWEKGDDEASRRAYLNCPMEKPEYEAFVAALREARVVEPHAGEEPKYFEGCLPIEVMAKRGPKTLAFGPLKPIGLIDPRTGRRPYAVLQLRPENREATSYNLVGCQTRMVRGEQARVFGMVPGLEHAEFERWGAVHRNTFVNAPEILDGFSRLRGDPELFLAGQLTGVEGYVESAASGLVVSWLLDDQIRGHALELPPETTCLGGLMRHLSRRNLPFQPSNVTFAMLAPLGQDRPKHRAERAQLWVERSLSELDGWLLARGRAARIW